MRLLRVIFFLMAFPFALTLALVGFVWRPRQRDEETHADNAIVTEEQAEDADLEGVNDDEIRRWLIDLSPTRRGKRLRQAHARLAFKPRLPFMIRRNRQ